MSSNATAKAADQVARPLRLALAGADRLAAL
jgi:hypothetical protein